jgi:hypothetical protein
MLNDGMLNATVIKATNNNAAAVEEAFFIMKDTPLYTMTVGALDIYDLWLTFQKKQLHFECLMQMHGSNSAEKQLTYLTMDSMSFRSFWPSPPDP